MKTFDVLVLGAGWGGLAAASLLARSGRRVAVLEAQDRAGGCGQSFSREGFTFCAEMQYLMGCAPGGVVHGWLRDLDLHETVKFNSLDADGYDRIVLPGFEFRIPMGASRLQARLKDAFPDEAGRIDRIFDVMNGMAAEIGDESFDATHWLTEPLRFKNTVLYGPWSATRVFDHFGLSPRLRAVLAGQCGDIGLGPRDEPFFCLVAVLFGYCDSAHFPALGMGFFLDEVLGRIRRDGGEILLDTRVTGLVHDGNRVAEVETTRGDFSAGLVVSNIDPGATMAMSGLESAVDYEPSASCFTLFAGLDVDLREQGFGRSNVWSYPGTDLDEAIDRPFLEHDYRDPFFFLSTPSLYADDGVLAPKGCTTVQVDVGSSHEWFEDAQRRGVHDEVRSRVADEILAAVERRVLPGLRRHAVFVEAWSPVDLERHTGLPHGGMYGARLDFRNRVLRRVRPETPLANLYLTGATAGGPGLAGVVTAGTRLARQLIAKG